MGKKQKTGFFPGLFLIILSGYFDMQHDPDYQEIKSDLAGRMDQWFEEIDKPDMLFKDAKQ